MKEINLTMDQNGHIHYHTGGGVIGDHNAALLKVVFEVPLTQAGYFRLFFAGDAGTLMTEELFLSDGCLMYTLPSEVTRLGTTVLCQLCGYAGTGENMDLLYKSDTFPLTFGTSLPDTADLADSSLTDRLNAMLEKVETIAQTFDVQIGTVTTLGYNEPAAAVLSRSDDMLYTLDLGIPKGEKGDGDFSAGKRVTIVNGVISVDSCPIVYESKENLYEYIGIEDTRTMAQLAGTVFFVNPRYRNANTNVPIYTSGEEVYYALHLYKNGELSSSVPVGAILPGRLMALYVTNDGIPVYLNPYETAPNPLPTCTVTPGNSTDSFPSLSFSFTDYTPFEGEKTIIAMATADISLDGIGWYGPMLCPITVFNGNEWVTVKSITGKTIKAGQPLLMTLDFNGSNYSFDHIRLLNPPQL